MKQWLCKCLNKRRIVFLGAIAVVYLLVGRDWSIKHRVGDDLQLDLFWGNTVMYFDNHDHVWHNDGATVMVMKFAGQAAEEIREQLAHSVVWESYPMSDTLHDIAYEKSHTWATPSLFAEMADLPEIQNGYWFFVDQDTYCNGLLMYGDKSLKMLEQEKMQAEKEFRQWWRLPGGYAVALYDLDTDTLYYFQRNL